MSTQSLIIGISLSLLFLTSCKEDTEKTELSVSRVKDLAAANKFERLESSDKVVAYGNGRSTISLHLNSRKILFDDTLLIMNGPATVNKQKWVISDADTRGILAPLINPHKHLHNMGGGLVVLDPGHGGSDPGASGKMGTREKDVVLDIATRVKNILESRGAAVRMTRDSDTALSLTDRSTLAEQWNADVMVSIHINSSPNSVSKGAETFALTGNGYPSTAQGSKPRGMCPGNRFDPANTVLAYEVHRSLMKRTGLEDRGVKRARFSVLRNASCPAALVEAGFISNSAEEQRIRTDAYRLAAAEGIAEGILAYLQHVRKASPRIQPSK